MFHIIFYNIWLKYKLLVILTNILNLNNKLNLNLNKYEKGYI